MCAKMAEDDEIDVLGDFNLDILSKNGSNIFDNNTLVSQNEILPCEYTIYPQWLFDRPSTNPSHWYSSSNDLDIAKQFEFATSSTDTHVSTENSITDESGWTEKEKNLLERGIEIFGKNSVNLSQFISSRTSAEVKYYLKNFYSDVQLSYTSLNDDIIFDDNCIEETVIDCNYSETSRVNTDSKMNVNVQALTKHLQNTIFENFVGIPDRSRTKPFMNEKLQNNPEEASSNAPSGKHKKRTSPKEYKKKVATHQHDSNIGHCLLKSNNIKLSRPDHVNNRGISNRTNSKAKVKFRFQTKIEVNKNKLPLKKHSVRQIRSDEKEEKNFHITTGKGLGVPLCEGEEVIKIKKESELEDSETDIDIDIEDSEDKSEPPKPSDTVKKIAVSTIETVKSEPPVKQKIVEDTRGSKQVKAMPSLSDCDKDTLQQLQSLETPSCELYLERDVISEVEKFVFFEFFEGRPTKTPSRYLKIRNHILNAWDDIKPNYVTKTSIRQGLKQCGDVNCIGRIHNYLEQMGAINFGCEQIVYSRPLLDMMAPPKERASVEPEPVVRPQPLLPRQRIKKFLNDGEGGCTLTHDATGSVINTTVVNEESNAKQKMYIKKPAIRLIYCRPFSGEKQQEFSIHLELSALILMDLHAHMFLTEVMGLVGGRWNAREKILSITRYEPCKNIAQSSTHCDMCPISQAKAADVLHREHLDILGWYHSHPTFAPEPSQQDLDTQLTVQQWIGTNKPCIGFILSPFNLHGALIASPYRCLIVDKKENFEDQFVPYKFKVDLVADNLNVAELLRRAYNITHSYGNVDEKSRVDFDKMYFQDNSITYLDKYIYSVKMHLAKCSNINKMTCDYIIEGLNEVCRGKL